MLGINNGSKNTVYVSVCQKKNVSKKEKKMACGIKEGWRWELDFFFSCLSKKVKRFLQYRGSAGNLAGFQSWHRQTF